MLIRVGFEIAYSCPQPVATVLKLGIERGRISDLLRPDTIILEPNVPLREFTDSFGNRCARLVSPAGLTRLKSETIMHDSGEVDPVNLDAREVPVQELPSSQIISIGFNTLGRYLADGLLLLRQQLDLQLVNDRMSNLILDGEDVGEIPIVTLGPDVATISPIDELRGDADPRASLSNAALQDELDRKILADLLHARGFPLVAKGSVVRDHEETRNLRQVGNEILGDTVAKILLLRISTHVAEGEHNNRWLLNLVCLS